MVGLSPGGGSPTAGRGSLVEAEESLVRSAHTAHAQHPLME